MYESQKRWRRRADTTTLGVWVGLMLLATGAGVTTPPPVQATCTARVTIAGLNQPQYKSNPGLYPGVGNMADFVHSFLQTVQPHPFPTDLLLKLFKDPQKAQSDPDTLKQVLVYQTGFLVCAAIGVLYIVFMPLVGFFLACCRCCGYCGGYMYHEQTSRVHCWRRTLYWGTFLVTLIILAGNICMFKSNEDLKVSVDHSQEALNSTLGNLQTYLHSVPQQLDHVVNESYRTVNVVTHNLDDIGPLLGREIQLHVEGPLLLGLQSVRDVVKVANRTTVLLRALNTSLDELSSSMALVQFNASALRDQINQTISQPACISCETLKPELDRLNLDSSFPVPSLSELQGALDKVTQADLSSKVNEGEDFVRSIPQRVTNSTRDTVQSVKRQLVDIRNQISQVTKDIPISVLTNASDALVQIQGEVHTYTPQVERGEHIRWAVCVVLSSVVLLVVACNVLGLLLGPLGLRPKVDPTERSCTADCGGTFFMMGAGFSFLFSWLFMLVVLLLFLLGGNVYTLVCKPWRDGTLLKIIDTPGLIPGFELGPMLGLKSNLTVEEIYRDCEKNMPLWTTLHLSELMDLNSLLNVSKYTEEIQQSFNSTDITLPTITLLSADDRAQLSGFSQTAIGINFTTATQQIKDMSSINLNTSANNLETLASVQPDRVKEELLAEAAELRKIQVSIETTINPKLVVLNSTIQALRAIAEQVNGTVGEVLSKVGTAQSFLNSNSTELIVKRESRKFLDCQIGYFTTFANWANLTITQQIGRCGPVAQAVDSAEIIVCSHMVESLNAFWFSLGWCMIFFIPSIIFSVKLAKYYRRMEHTNTYHNHITMNHIPRAQVKPY